MAFLFVLLRNTLNPNELIWQLIIAFALGGTLAYLFWKQRKEIKMAQDVKKLAEAQETAAATSTKQMQLQSYERLILLADRLALPNLVARLNEPGLSAREMQAVLIHNIKTEFEYNVTQQMYVTQEAWEAIRNLKDQNMLIVNQITSFLPAEATAQDLNRSILEMLMQNPKASLHTIVSDALSYEARKLMV
ncbi:hypothetical protein [Paraflavitalea sp. CAU 1676]|uniref:DUF7935 family protein n=1 Tax=Paraflavitalea sp. CAU 1676 TaxID=3032598 RepID=UPI0023DC9652|nr:hypothetical protein [Paraflavitalea sp. CAU 1676]MDF2188155.1 hypothetical protein [Paraflavitalea sp. CAU 1676]